MRGVLTTTTPNAAKPRLEERWRLSGAVALRPEPFGALAYHFGNRRLTFLKLPRLVAVVRGLGGQPDVRSALTVAGVPQEQWSAYLAALGRLAGGDMIERVQDGSEVGE